VFKGFVYIMDKYKISEIFTDNILKLIGIEREIPKHIHPEKFRELKEVGKIPRALETFCIFREPMEHIESWYRYRTRDELLKPSHPKHHNSTKHLTYDQFITAYLSENRPSYANVARQSDFVSDGRKLLIDNIFLIDNIKGVEMFLSEKLETIL
jgi:hypothetical protein